MRDVWAQGAAPDATTSVSRTLDAYDSALLLLTPADPKDQQGDHPYTKLLRNEVEVKNIEAAQQAAFARASRCSYKW